MKTVTFTNDQLECVKSVLRLTIQLLTVWIDNRVYIDQNHPELMDLRDRLDVARQALAQVEAAQ